jgi:hypothetical protein
LSATLSAGEPKAKQNCFRANIGTTFAYFHILLLLDNPTQRSLYVNNKIRVDRKKLLDEIDFVWKAVTGPARYSTRSSASLPNEGLIEESEQVQQGDVRNRFECPSRNRKCPWTCLADSGEMAARTGSCSCVEDDAGGLDEEDSNTSLMVTGRARIGSDPAGQEVDQEEASLPKFKSSVALHSFGRI